MKTPPENIAQLNFANDYLQENLLSHLHIMLAIVCIFAPLLIAGLSMRNNPLNRSIEDRKARHVLSMTMGLAMTVPLYMFSWALSPAWYTFMEIFLIFIAASLGVMFSSFKE